MRRLNGRAPHELRKIKITRGFTRNPAGSVLIQTGKTMVLCTASWVEGVPAWRQGKGEGWMTAEYDMLPAATSERRKRNRTSVDGRTQEIQRLIGRSLRAVLDLAALGENTLHIDCDVLQADGGTRTAAITGAFVALSDAVEHARRRKWLTGQPVREAVAAVSVGRIAGRVLLDLNYQEDVEAEVDMNVVMTGSGRFVEVQGTGEEASFSRAELDKMLVVAQKGITRLLALQRRALQGRKR